MFTARVRSHAASPEIAARWMTASTLAHAAVIAPRSVTEAVTPSSPGPVARGAVSSRRRVRPGWASRGRSMVPIRPAAPVMRIAGTPAKLSGRPEGPRAYRRAGGRPGGHRRSGVVAEAEPVQRAQPQVPAALVAVGPGDRGAGQLDDRRPGR